jgi:poly-gamma-glutamate biosynthesis protein PgsC/CapC
MVPEAIGLGLLVSLFFAEALGLTASGLVVPGYVALHLDQPMMVLGTLLAGVVTMVAVRAIGRLVLLYGRRTLVLCVIVGYLVGQAVPPLLGLGLGRSIPDIGVIGYIISGLIGYWMVRQGILETTATLLMASVIVRLILVIVHGGGLLKPSIML